MYHMNFVRKSFTSKLRNSSTTDRDFLSLVESRIEEWAYPQPFDFPNKKKFELDKVRMSSQRTIRAKVENMTPVDPKNVLLLTNHLYEWAGSETIIVELIEAFVAKGAQVTVFANDIGDEFSCEISHLSGCRIVHDAADIELSEFDLVYCQHQVITRFLGPTP